MATCGCVSNCWINIVFIVVLTQIVLQMFLNFETTCSIARESSCKVHLDRSDYWFHKSIEFSVSLLAYQSPRERIWSNGIEHAATWRDTWLVWTDPAHSLCAVALQRKLSIWRGPIHILQHYLSNLLMQSGHPSRLLSAFPWRASFVFALTFLECEILACFLTRSQRNNISRCTPVLKFRDIFLGDFFKPDAAGPPKLISMFCWRLLFLDRLQFGDPITPPIWWQFCAFWERFTVANTWLRRHHLAKWIAPNVAIVSQNDSYALQSDDMATPWLRDVAK